jgi:queuine tRNA-ribosyltransferase
VGPGPASGPKSTTTVAFNDPKLALHIDMPLLGQDWLTRWERSHTKTARDLSHTDEEEFAARIRQHPQFKVSPKSD